MELHHYLYFQTCGFKASITDLILHYELLLDRLGLYYISIVLICPTFMLVSTSSTFSFLLGRLLGMSEQGSRASIRRVYLARLSESLLGILDTTALLQFSRMNNEYI
jgi:hypothetical protein